MALQLRTSGNGVLAIIVRREPSVVLGVLNCREREVVLVVEGRDVASVAVEAVCSTTTLPHRGETSRLDMPTRHARRGRVHVDLLSVLICFSARL